MYMFYTHVHVEENIHMLYSRYFSGRRCVYYSQRK